MCFRRWLTIGALLLCGAQSALAQHLLLPMDDGQRNHLKAYGVVFQALKGGQKAEWFLNYRGGAFLLPDVPDLRKRAAHWSRRRVSSGASSSAGVAALAVDGADGWAHWR